MPLRVCTGFEHGVSNLVSLTKGNTGNKLFDVANGSPTMVTSPVRTGTYALELNPSAALENVGWDTTNGTIPASQNRAVLHFAIRFPTALPTTDVRLCETIPATGTVVPRLFFRNSDDKLVASVDGVLANGEAGPVVVADTWYVVELSIDLSAGTWTMDWRVGGVAQTQDTVVAAANTLLRVIIGSNATQTMTAVYDDVALWTDTAAISTYPHGPAKVVMLIPDTGGTTTEIGTANATGRMVTNSAIDATHNSANILAAISEVPPLIGASATGVGQRTAGAGNAVGIPMTTYTLAGGESFLGLRVLVVGWAATALTNNIGLRTFNGTTESTLFATADPNFDADVASPAWLCKMAIDADFDTQTEVGGQIIRFGYSTDIAPLPGAHAIYAELAIKEAAGPTTWDLAATGTGTSAGTAALRSTVVMASTGTGTSDGVAPLTSTLALASIGTGTSTGTANLVITTGGTTYDLSATGAGASAGTAALTAVNTLASTGIGASVGTAALLVTHALSSTGTGVSDGSAALKATLAASSTGTGTSTGSANLTIVGGPTTWSLTATGIGTTTGLAALAERLALAALGVAASTGIANLVIVGPEGPFSPGSGTTSHTPTATGTTSHTPTAAGTVR